LIWAHAYGKPVERVEQGDHGEFGEMTNTGLKAKLAAAIAVLSSLS
jgi:hypothetical protein